MVSNMIGIAIESRRLNLAVIRSGNVTAQASVRLPQGLAEKGRVTDRAALAALIRETLSARGIRIRSCALVLPRERILTRQLQLPAMEPAELKLNLPFEFRDMTERALSDYDFDYILRSQSGETMELWAAAVLREEAEEYRQLLKLAGLRLEIAVPAEIALANLLCAHPELPDPLCILQADRNRIQLDIFSGGAYRTGKELPGTGDASHPADAEALRRALNLYNFSLAPGTHPVRDLVLPEDFPETERTLLARVTGMNVHPGSLLSGGAAAGAALPVPGKRNLNLIQPYRPFRARKMLPLVALLAAALLAFAKFGTLDPLEAKARAYNDLSARQARLEQANHRLLEYDDLFQDYIRYGESQMRSSETDLVSRSQILSLVESTIAPLARVDNLTVNGNTLTANLSGITLDGAGDLVARLEQQEGVLQAGILSATADDGSRAHILLTITFGSEEERHD